MDEILDLIESVVEGFPTYRHGQAIQQFLEKGKRMLLSVSFALIIMIIRRTILIMIIIK